MIPADLANVEQQLLLWMVAMLRPGAALLAAPMFGAAAVPLQVRLILSLAIAIPAATVNGMVLPEAGIMSLNGFLMISAEIVAGLALGFVLQLAFAAALVAGEVISNAMGLGFASLADPAGGPASPAVGQFLSMLAMFLFLATDGHLMLVAIIVDSYRALPPGAAWLPGTAIYGMVEFGGLAFSAGLTIALPVGFALILVQIIMAMVARSAPTLNIFAVGLPATLLAGICLLGAALPLLADSISHSINLGIEAAHKLASGHHV